MMTSSRRDDIVNLMYMLIYFKQMDLPWCDFLFCMPCDSAEKTFKMVLQKKEQYTLEYLAKSYQFSPAFIELASMVDALRYEEYPNYERMHRILESIVCSQQADSENRVFQWKRVLQHNKYTLIKIFSDEEMLLRIQSNCKHDVDSLNFDS